MHIDTDEGNAAGLGRGAAAVLVDTEALGGIQRRDTKYDEAAE